MIGSATCGSCQTCWNGCLSSPTVPVISLEDIPEPFLARMESLNQEERRFPQQEEMSAYQRSDEMPTMTDSSQTRLKDVMERTERAVFEQVLRESRTKTEAIRKLGISRRTFYKRLKMYGLN